LPTKQDSLWLSETRRQKQLFDDYPAFFKSIAVKHFTVSPVNLGYNAIRGADGFVVCICWKSPANVLFTHPKASFSSEDGPV
jgi:hypothetical protein